MSTLPDINIAEKTIIQAARPFTMTSEERLYAVIQSVQHVSTQNIPGAIVECGVWKGGSMVAAALTIKSFRLQPRDLYLFDTFSGMTEPESVDIDLEGNAALKTYEEMRTGPDSCSWANAPLNEVKRVLFATGYPQDKIHFIKGKVEDTIPEQAPDQIAVLRLDTDWYRSTRHELEYLYPRLSVGGVLIVDDYGHFQGARKAVDEYFARSPIFLSRIDYTGRLALKPAPVVEAAEPAA
jgi:hypothetical protein